MLLGYYNVCFAAILVPNTDPRYKKLTNEGFIPVRLQEG
jgi:hypothetical protein